MKMYNTRLGCISCEQYGKHEGTALVIEAGIAASSTEWRHVAEEFASGCRVIVYDRTGYGASPASPNFATPENRAKELRALLETLGVESDIVLLGHSQGGLYAAEYALLYPETVKGLVLLDPATPFDEEFRTRLTPPEYRASGVDKTASFRLGLLITSLGLGFTFRPLLRQSPPFFYHKFEADEEQEVLRSLTRRTTYRTALREYRYSHLEEPTRMVTAGMKSGTLGQIPVRLITHSHSFYVEELKRYAGMDETTAQKVDDIWQEIMGRYLGLSTDSRHIEAPKSGHSIHLTDLGIVRKAVLELL